VSSSKSQVLTRPQVDGIITDFLDVTALYKYPEGNYVNAELLIPTALAEHCIPLS
jgi:hypothetical protein